MATINQHVTICFDTTKVITCSRYRTDRPNPIPSGKPGFVFSTQVSSTFSFPVALRFFARLGTKQATREFAAFCALDVTRDGPFSAHNDEFSLQLQPYQRATVRMICMYTAVCRLEVDVLSLASPPEFEPYQVAETVTVLSQAGRKRVRHDPALVSDPMQIDNSLTSQLQGISELLDRPMITQPRVLGLPTGQSLYDRPEQVNDVRKLIMGGNPVVGVHGTSGIGKTTLCQLIARDAEIQKAFEVIALIPYQDNKDRETDNPFTSVQHLAMLLDLPDRTSLSASDLNLRVAEALAGRRVLVILDDPSSSKPIESLQKLDLPFMRIMFSTTDSRLHGGCLYAAELPALDVAVAMLSHLSGFSGSDLSELQALVEWCDRLPLAIAVLGALMSKLRPFGYRPSQFLPDCIQYGVGIDHKLSLLLEKHLQYMRDDETDRTSKFLTTRLDDFVVFAKSGIVHKHAIECLWHPASLIDCGLVIARLVELHLLQPHRGETFRMHRLICNAFEKRVNTAESRRRVLLQMLSGWGDFHTRHNACSCLEEKEGRYSDLYGVIAYAIAANPALMKELPLDHSMRIPARAFVSWGLCWPLSFFIENANVIAKTLIDCQFNYRQARARLYDLRVGMGGGEANHPIGSMTLSRTEISAALDFQDELRAKMRRSDVCISDFLHEERIKWTVSANMFICKQCWSNTWWYKCCAACSKKCHGDHLHMLEPVTWSHICDCMESGACQMTQRVFPTFHHDDDPWGFEECSSEEVVLFPSMAHHTVPALRREDVLAADNTPCYVAAYPGPYAEGQPAVEAFGPILAADQVHYFEVLIHKTLSGTVRTGIACDGDRRRAMFTRGDSCIVEGDAGWQHSPHGLSLRFRGDVIGVLVDLIRRRLLVFSNGIMCCPNEEGIAIPDNFSDVRPFVGSGYRGEVLEIKSYRDCELLRQYGAGGEAWRAFVESRLHQPHTMCGGSFKSETTMS
eukprot:TRINITY_DN8836_c0_g4_i1.p1 TRINITY_DN8836_c0_g4~~TRINITY_DN8836_c0_g4_i1.p1  ORF type:complete len:966 (-),score=117.54 TRINITY_DN8836_c0_g4_i1:983-3880(-)